MGFPIRVSKKVFAMENY